MKPRAKAVRVASIVREEFRCSQMSAEARSLDDALEIMRNWTESQQVVYPSLNVTASRPLQPLQASPFEVNALLGRVNWPLPLQHSVLDIRPADEFATERMPKAASLPWSGRDDAASFALRAVEQHGIGCASRLVLVGADPDGAADAHDAAAALSDMLGTNLAETVILRGGFAAWRDESFPTEGLRSRLLSAARFLQTRAWS